MSIPRASRISLLVFLLILAAAGLGWRDHQRLASLRATHGKLIAQAAARGISVDSAQARASKRPREDRAADARLAAAGFIAYAKEMESVKWTPGFPDDVTELRMADQMDRMTALDGNQLKIVIDELVAAKDIADSTRANLIAFSVRRLAIDHPQAALRILAGLSASFHRTTSAVLVEWARKDPAAALGWFRANSVTFPADLTDFVKPELIYQAADPKTAFQLLGEFGMDPKDFIPGIARKAVTPEERTAVLVTLREWLGTTEDRKVIEEVSGEAIRILAMGESNDPEGFDSSTRWIAGANFSRTELESITRGLEKTLKLDESGKWIEWLGQTLPADTARERIFHLVKHWSERNFKAAGAWLASTPDSPAKHAATCAYAETICSKDPAMAIQWALSVPEGEDRDRTLNELYNAWPKDDPAGAAAFANEHGIE